jgi:hypothetical protein
LLLGKPFKTDEFDFGDNQYFDAVYAFAEDLTKVEEIRNSKVARGSKDGLYINRTYFGLYSMLNDLRANVRTTRPDWLRSKKISELV